MKNPELKQKYLDSIEVNDNTRYTYNSSIQSFGSYEDKVGKDFAEMTEQEVLDYLRSPDSGNSMTAATRLGVIRRYVQFYSEETGHKSEFLDTLLAKDKRVKEILGEKELEELGEPITHQDLMDMVSAIPNPRDRAIILSLYEGLYGKNFSEILEIRPEDVKQSKIYVRQRDKNVSVSPELIAMYRQAMHTNIYTNPSDKRKIELVDGENMALKKLEGQKNEGRAISYLISKLAFIYNFPETFSVTNLRYWGLANYLAERAIRDEVDAKAIYSRYRVAVLEQYNLTRIPKERTINMVQKTIEKIKKESKPD